MKCFVTRLTRQLKRFSSRATLSIALIFFAVAPSWGETIYVPQDFSSIRAAARTAAPYDTIIVAGGRYDEAIVLDKPVTLLGAQRGVNPSETGRSGKESVIVERFPIRITSKHVRVVGFEIADFEQGITIDDPLNQDGTDSTDKLDDITISHNWIHSEQSPVRAGIRTAAHTAQRLVVSHNLLDVYDASPSTAPLAAIELNGSSTRRTPLHYENIVVTSNVLRNQDGASEQEGGYGILGGTKSSADVINGLIIHRNLFRNAAYGANFNLQNVLQGTFSSNVVEDAPGALGFYSGTVSGNTFRMGGRLVLWTTAFDPSVARDAISSPRFVTIRNNDFTSDVNGRAITVGYGILSSTISVRRNAFRNTGVSGELLQSLATGVLNAGANWWDNSAGPSTHTGSLLGLINTSPWLVTGDEAPTALQLPSQWPLSESELRTPGFWPAL